MSWKTAALSDEMCRAGSNLGTVRDDVQSRFEMFVVRAAYREEKVAFIWEVKMDNKRARPGNY